LPLLMDREELGVHTELTTQGDAMTAGILQVKDSVVVECQHLDQFLQASARRGYQVVGPTIREGAIVYDQLTSARDLPAEWTDEQDDGKYRLKKRADETLFGFVLGPDSWKNFLHPPT
jgi:sulfhydrogenase subunit beta (sulfur reductase)